MMIDVRGYSLFKVALFPKQVDLECTWKLAEHKPESKPVSKGGCRIPPTVDNDKKL